MGFVNSPIDHSNSSSTNQASRSFKALFWQVYRRTRGFLEAQKLPFFASKACEAYLGQADQAQRSKCRRLLGTRLELNPKQLHRFFHTALGQDLLSWLERFFHLSKTYETELLLRDLLLEMATDPEGLSLLSFLRRSPHQIQPNLDQLLLTIQQVKLLLEAAETTVETIRQLSIAEAQTQSDVKFSHLPDIRQSGPFQVKHFSLLLEQVEHTDGVQARVLCYQPIPWPDYPVSVVVQSHGLASTPADLATYGKHLASYGFFVVALQHTGSDTEQTRSMLAGQAQEVFQLTEFIHRPLAISRLLDELEHRNASEFEGKLNLHSVGIMGCSFGAYTALTLAGANLNFEALEPACQFTHRKPNISLLLQCQALGLPRQTYEFRDDRIQAVVAIDAVGSELLGQSGIAKIQVPVLLIAGDQDITAPLVLEQIRMFHWLTSKPRYLALLQGKSHIQDFQQLMSSLDIQLKALPQRSLPAKATPFEYYIKALSLAFFHQTLQPDETIPELSAAYASFISHPDFPLWLISEASNSHQHFTTLEQTRNDEESC